jgi:hypothetical protein
MRAAVAAIALLVLAGCAKPAPSAGAGPAGDGRGDYLLQGTVVDAGIRPLAGVTVRVLETDENTTTDADGWYGFKAPPVERFLVLVANKTGFHSASQQITVPATGAVRLNFTMAPLPTKVPFHDVLKFDGVLQCQVATSIAQQNSTYECGTAIGEKDKWDFAVGPDFAGAVIEMAWAPLTPAADSLGMRLDSLELGQLNLNLGETLGTNPLRITVPNSVAVKYYPEGGLMRFQAFAAADAAANEAGVGVSAPFSQPFTAYASLFYVTPPDPSYTLNNP